MNKLTAVRDRESHVVMIGTAPETLGGISTAVSVLKRGGLFDRCGVSYIATHCDGSVGDKLALAIRAWTRFTLWLLSGRVALLHAHTSVRSSFWRKVPFIVPAIFCGVPVVLHLHSGAFHIYYGEESSALKRCFIRWVFEHSCRVVVLSESWQSWARTAFPAANVLVIPNPVEIPPSKPDEAAVRQDETLLFLGRLGHGKGVYDLLQAVAALQPRHPGLRLRLGGDGEFEAVGQQAAALGIGQQIELLGWVRGEAKSRLLEESSVFVLPSYNEGLPMSVLEAMAHGLPVVSTPVGGIPEAVRDGEEGFLVQPGDIQALAERISRLLEDVALRTQMGQAARYRAKSTFGVDRVVEQWVKLYSNLGAK